MEDIKSMNVRNWKNVAQNRDRWKKVVEQARTLNRLWRFIKRRSGQGKSKTLNLSGIEISGKTLKMTALSLYSRNFPNTGVKYVLFNDIRLCTDII